MFPERIHADIEPRLVCKFCEIWMTGNKQTRALITGQKNFRWLARSRFFADRVQNLSGPAPDNILGVYTPNFIQIRLLPAEL